LVFFCADFDILSNTFNSYSCRATHCNYAIFLNIQLFLLLFGQYRLQPRF
jgi:hypothetical protein